MRGTTAGRLYIPRRRPAFLFIPPSSFSPFPLSSLALTTNFAAMAGTSSSDVIVLAVGIVIAAVYLFRDQLFSSSKSKSVPIPSQKVSAGGGNPRDFIAKMKEGVSSLTPRAR